MEPDNRWKPVARMIAAFIIPEIRELLKVTEPKIECRYMNIKQCAKYCDKSVTAIYRMVAKREIPFIRLGRCLRFDKQKIDEMHMRGAA